MKQELENDEELRYGYQSNIAMLLHYRFDLPKFRDRNEAANDILKLVFELEGSFIDWREGIHINSCLHCKKEFSVSETEHREDGWEYLYCSEECKKVGMSKEKIDDRFEILDL